jgi:PAS domain S-box-containing protein
MTGVHSLDENLSLLVEKARRLLGTDTSYIALRDEDSGDVYMHTLSGISTEAFKTMRIPFGAGLGGKVAVTGRGCIVEDYFQEIGPLLHDIVRAEGLISGIAVPIQIGQTNLGVLYVFNRNRTSFSKSELETLSLLGNLAAVEISRRRAQDDLQKSRDELENRVQERTAQLQSINDLLEGEIEERRRLEERLRAGEHMLRTILSTSPVGIAFTVGRRIKWANDAWAKMFGFEDETRYTGKTTRIIYASRDEYERVGNILYNRVGHGEVTETDTRFRRQDGTLFDAHVRIKAVDPSDLTKGAISAVADISDRKRAEDALRESEARYRLLTQNSLTGIFIHQDGVFVYVNNRLCEIQGHPHEEMIGKPFWQFVHPDDREMVKGYGTARYEGKGGPPHHRFRVVRKDGTTRWVDVLSAPIIYRGRPASMGNVADITDRKMAEDALRESEQKYRFVVENAGEAIYVAQDGKLRLVNPKCSEMTGYSQEQLISTPFLTFVHPDDRTMVMERHKRRLLGEAPPGTYTFRLIDAYGNTKEVELNAVPISWEGRPATLNFLSDITARRKMEDELLKIEKLESLGILAGGIAHDFNNILTAVLGNLSVAVLSAGSNDKLLKRLTEAEKACVRAQGLTHQLLTFSKGGAPVKDVVDISKLIVEGCRFALRGSNVGCEFSVPEDLMPVEVDQAQINQVVNNLVINANQAMPQGGTIRLEAKNVIVTPEEALPLEPGQYVRISVKDEGIGIPKDHIPRIFDPYFTTKQTGSGLGLATAYAIVRNHQGLITVESVLGRGATFHVFLPVSDKTLEHSEPVRERPVPGKGKILLMDDEEAIRDLAREILTLLGYEVVLAKDGQDAVALYNEAKKSGDPFDAVVMDLTIPGGMGGGEAIRILRETDPEIKAIVSSGYSNDPIMAEYEQFGFSGVVAKPYTINQLSEVLSEVIGSET